jgi:ELWxxDGT repeat protein
MKDKAAICAFVLLLGLASWPAYGQASAQLVKDINTGPLPAGGGGRTEMVELNGAVLFFSDDRVHGTELWRSDGTPAGTYLVKDICPGICPSIAFGGYTRIVKAGGIVFFVASDGSTGFELWKTDGTAAGTVLVKDINPGVESAFGHIESLTAYGSQAFFVADDGQSGELWASDGTSAGTRIVKELNLDTGISRLAELNGLLYFFRGGSAFQNLHLWRTDGTEPGTLLVTQLPNGTEGCSHTAEIVQSNGKLFFCARDNAFGAELWQTNGTPAGTFRVADIKPGPEHANPGGFTDFGGVVYFSADDGSTGRELWMSNGTPEGTARVKDINPGIASSFPSLKVAGTTLFFGADDGLFGRELWKTDGTALGTTLVQDIRPGPAGSSPSGFANVGGLLFFVANDGLTGPELWRSNGDPGGTFRLSDIAAGSTDSHIRFVASLTTTTALFFAYDGNSMGLWKSDGTPSGTSLVASQQTNSGSHPFSFTDVGGTSFFFAWDNAQLSLWKSDGTAIGTVALATFVDVPNGFASPRPLAMNGVFYFVADDGIHGSELWRSNGSSFGTYMVKDIHPGAISSGISWIEVVEDSFQNRQLIFGASDGISGFEIWRSDGLEENTYRVSDICPGPCPSASNEGVAVMGDSVFFAGSDGQNHGLWRSNGTAAGTQFVKDVAIYSRPPLVNANGLLFFLANYPGPPYVAVWKSDGTTQGTGPVAPIPPYEAAERLFAVGNLALFFAYQSSTGLELWRTDGTPAGTMLVKDIVPGPGEPTFAAYDPDGDFFEIRSYFAASNNNLFFSLHDGQSGFELWKSDGTAAGTHMVKDIVPGAAGSSPRALTVLDGVLVFQASDETHGSELWRSDGTLSGTFMVQDIAPGPSGSLSRAGLFMPGIPFVASGTKVFFAAEDGLTGLEPWVMDRAAIQINTLTGSGVPVEPVDATTGDAPVILTFGSVTQPGVTTLTTSGGGTPPPVGFSLGSPATYYEVTTTAQFSGSVDICIDYTGVSYTDETQLRLFHLEGGSWIDRTTSLDMANDIICGQVTSFSPFLVLERVNQAPVARITVPASILVREAAVYSGTTSSDADGFLTTFAWSFSDGTSASGPTVGHTFNASGNYVVGLTVTDDFGTTASTTVAIHVMSESEAIANLAALVASFNLQQGIANSLDQKLQNVLEALNSANAGNRQDAANKLQSFINEVEAQRDKKLTSAQADQLIAAAQRILAVL